MMTTIYGEEDPDVYGEIYLADFWAGQEDRIYVAEDREEKGAFCPFLDTFPVFPERHQPVGDDIFRSRLVHYIGADETESTCILGRYEIW